MKRFLKSNKKDLTLWYTALLLVLSQTAWDQAVVFLSIPLLIHLELNRSVSASFGLKNIFFLKMIIFTGFLVGIVHLAEYDLYYFSRDIMYFIQAPIFIIIGFYMSKNIIDFRELIRIVVISSLVITIYKLIELVLNPALLTQLGLETRYEYSLSNATALLAFTILFYARICKFKLFENFQEWLMMSISLFSVAISFSRTDYFLLLVMILIPLITKSIYILKIYWLTVFVVVLIIFGGFFIKVESSSVEEDTFQSKINHSFNEILVQDYETSFEISQNWRGYEAFLGLTKFSEGNFIEILVGQGFGTVVYTPNWIFNGEMDSLDVLPMFHNGFITVLLKTGLLGLFFFFLFLFKLLNVALKVSVLSFSKLEKLTTMLLQAAVFTVLLLTFVVHGIFTTTTPVLLLIIVGATLKMKTLRGKIIKLN